nr:hypothetical protein [Mesorhizobium sp. B2-6-1]
MKFGEYRRSLDVDFLCADADGYRELRTHAVQRGIRAFFPEPVEAVRDFQIDQYGLRTIVRLQGQPDQIRSDPRRAHPTSRSCRQ